MRLVEELNLRTQRLQPLLEKLDHFSRRMDDLLEQVAEAEESPDSLVRPDEALAELRHLMKTSLESPATLRSRRVRTAKYLADYEAAKRDLSAGNLRLVVSIAKRYRNRGLRFSRSHSGGEHRPDSRRR